MYSRLAPLLVYCHYWFHSLTPNHVGTSSSDFLPLLTILFRLNLVVLDKTHWMLYWIVTAMYPQFLITLNEQLEEQAVTVRVGQAVNTVGLAGQRMGISGVSKALLWKQTHL